MMNRRTLLAALVAPLALLGVRKPRTAASRLPQGPEILRSFDARDWAKAFVAHVRQIPGLATDEETMTCWFANSLMRGYDEREHELQTRIREEGSRHVEFLAREEIQGAVARGWCSDLNRYKEMDCDLAEAIVQELLKLRPGPAPGNVLDHHWVRFLEENRDAQAFQIKALREYRDRVEAALV